MFFPMFDLTMVILIPAIILSLYAQAKVQSTFKKFSKVSSKKNITGAQVARSILDDQGLYSVAIESTPGKLSDHYDPRTKIVRLSPEVYRGN